MITQIKGFIVLLAISIATGCHSTADPDTAAADSTTAKPAVPAVKRNPEFRDHPKKEPVAEYKVRTDNTLNEMYFTVRLYETPVTMKYVAKVDYEGMGGEDTVKLPDVGIPPHPVLQKGPEKYSCIIGLQDNNNAFRELKKVYVTGKGGELKITTLKHYVVTDGYHLVAE